jgi:hypothetical protein
VRKITLLIIFSFILFACEKEKEKQLIIENSDIPLIDKVLIGGEIYKVYSYNNANLVTEEKSKFYYTRHNYNDMNQLITSDSYWDISMASSDSRVIEAAMNRKEWVSPENTPKSISHELKYNSNGQLIRKYYIRTGDVNTDYVEFIYKDDRIVREIGFYKNEIRSYTDLLYDDKGNLVKRLRYDVPDTGIAQLSTTSEYEFDNMPNPYLAFKRLTTPGIYTNANNIIKESTKIHNVAEPFIEETPVIEYSYEYNINGYPIKVNGLTEYVYK